MKLDLDSKTWCEIILVSKYYPIFMEVKLNFCFVAKKYFPERCNHKKYSCCLFQVSKSNMNENTELCLCLIKVRILRTFADGLKTSFYFA